MTMSVAIVGSGPTGIYTLSSLIKSTTSLRIVMFEKGEEVGVGMPYSAESAHRSMLANIASIEIPPICQSYLDWLRGCSDDALAAHGLKRDQLHDRLFTPRLLLGEYFRDQLLHLAKTASEQGYQIEYHEAREIIDIAVEDRTIVLHSNLGSSETFDRVVLATGHDFQSSQPARRGYFPNPWSGLIDEQIKEGDVGILGTSLSAIDTAMAVALQHGDFQRKSDGGLIFISAARELSITMLSRNGLLPEADFYCPIPYEPLRVLTDAAVSELVDTCKGQGGGLDRIFKLFAQELTMADPDYAARIGLAASTVDDFADRYFAERLSQDPFEWARKNLLEVEKNKAQKITVGWRYAILRMHETVQSLLPTLSEDERTRFDAGLRRVFIDNYAAVPPESIRRLLALQEAGLLKVSALGDDYDLSIGNGRTVVNDGDSTHVFDIFIDARGQKALSSEDLPFPSLRAALLNAGHEHPQVDENYRLVAPPDFAGRVAFGAIPYLMHDRPFVQGITESHEIGTAIARGMVSDLETATRRVRRMCA